MSSWLVLRTRPRWEKKVSRLMAQKGIESYCPLNKVQRKWSDRVKLIEEPLFRSCVFVKVDEAIRSTVRLTNGVINFVYWEGKLAKVKDREIRAIRQFLNKYEHVEPVRISYLGYDKDPVGDCSGTEVRNNALAVKNSTDQLVISSMGYTLKGSAAKNN